MRHTEFERKLEMYNRLTDDQRLELSLRTLKAGEAKGYVVEKNGLWNLTDRGVLQAMKWTWAYIAALEKLDTGEESPPAPNTIREFLDDEVFCEVSLALTQELGMSPLTIFCAHYGEDFSLH